MGGFWISSAEASQIRCHLPSGTVVTTTKKDCRSRIGLILSGSTLPSSTQNTTIAPAANSPSSISIRQKNIVPTFPTKPVNIRYNASKSHPEDIAVIIGNADYGKGMDIPNVTPVYADAEGIKRYATQALGIRPGNVIDLRDATSAQLVSVFGSPTNYKGKLFDWVKAGKSRVFVYYAGHGAPGGAEGSAYLVPSDADAARIELNGFPLSTLYANLGKLQSQSVTVVLEACFSGSSQGGAVVAKASPIHLKPKIPDVPANVTVIAAGKADQMASWEENSSHGLFTKYFLMGMSGEADGDNDGNVTHSELEAYLAETMTYFARRYYGRDQTVQIVVGR